MFTYTEKISVAIGNTLTLCTKTPLLFRGAIAIGTQDGPKNQYARMFTHIIWL